MCVGYMQKLKYYDTLYKGPEHLWILVSAVVGAGCPGTNLPQIMRDNCTLKELSKMAG